MGKLKMARLSLTVARLPMTAAVNQTKAERDRHRDVLNPWRQWYKTAAWQRLRWSVLVRDMFTCAMCGRLEAATSQLVADHTVAHRGDEALFWDADNLQCLCKPCHDSDKQREERARR